LVLHRRKQEISESTIWNWEHGGEPEIKHYPKIAEFLGDVPFFISLMVMTLLPGLTGPDCLTTFLTKDLAS